MVTSVKNICIKLMGEVGMAVPKSTQTRVVGKITYMVHPYACFQVYNYMYITHQTHAPFLHSLPHHHLVASRAQRYAMGKLK